MSSTNDINFLISVSSKLQLYFSYTAPWLGLGVSTFALLAIVLRKRREKNLIIYLFAWQYILAVIYPLNMLFNDPQFSINLFGINLNKYVSDPICKMSNMFLRFFYCSSPWIQVVIFIFYFWINWKIYLISLIIIWYTNSSKKFKAFSKGTSKK